MDNGASSYRRFLDGDDQGLTDLIREYRDGLTLYLNGCLGNIFAAEELMEEVFFRLAVKKPRFHGKSSFRTWLYAIGKHLAADYLRKNARIAERPIEDYGEVLREETLVETAYLREERKILLHRAMGKLSPDYRQALYLVYFEGFSNAETAVAMRRNKRQIENLLSRARSALKTQLEKEGISDENL